MPPSPGAYWRDQSIPLFQRASTPESDQAPERRLNVERTGKTGAGQAREPIASLDSAQRMRCHPRPGDPPPLSEETHTGAWNLGRRDGIARLAPSIGRHLRRWTNRSRSLAEASWGKHSADGRLARPTATARPSAALPSGLCFLRPHRRAGLRLEGDDVFDASAGSPSPYEWVRSTGFSKQT